MNLLFMVVIECNYYYPLLLVVTRLVVSRWRALCGSIVSCHVLIFVLLVSFLGLLSSHSVVSFLLRIRFLTFLTQ